MGEAEELVLNFSSGGVGGRGASLRGRTLREVAPLGGCTAVLVCCCEGERLYANLLRVVDDGTSGSWWVYSSVQADWLLAIR